MPPRRSGSSSRPLSLSSTRKHRYTRPRPQPVSGLKAAHSGGYRTSGDRLWRMQRVMALARQAVPFLPWRGRRPCGDIRLAAWVRGRLAVMGSITWGPEIARVYNRTYAARFEPPVLGPVVDRLAELARGGPAMEFAAGIGRVALPLSARGSPCAASGCPRTWPAAGRQALTRPPLPRDLRLRGRRAGSGAQ